METCKALRWKGQLFARMAGGDTNTLLVARCLLMNLAWNGNNAHLTTYVGKLWFTIYIVYNNEWYIT